MAKMAKMCVCVCVCVGECMSLLLYEEWRQQTVVTARMAGTAAATTPTIATIAKVLKDYSTHCLLLFQKTTTTTTVTVIITASTTAATTMKSTQINRY